jgi:hypothetical protein
MNCIEFESAMERAIELRQPLAATTLEHTMTCAACRRNWELQRQLEIAIAAWRLTQPPAKFTEAVMADVLQPAMAVDSVDDDLIADNDWHMVAVRSNPRYARRSARLLLVSPVACLLIAFLLMTFFSEKPSRLQVDDMVEAAQNRSEKFVAVGSPPDVSATISEVFTDFRSEYDDVASDTRLAAIDVVKSIPPRVAMSIPDEPNETETSLDHEHSGRVWHPISNRVKVAMGFLWQIVPSDGHSD